jgi:flagellar M-ring protein FliF
VNYRRAIEGELARTLEGMEEVESARVHVTQARESIFAEKEEHAKASVMLKVRQGRELARERTESIINLVASAVERLDPGDIAVMDTRGRLLSSPAREGLNGASAFSAQLEARGKLEAETAARVVSLIEPLTGAGHVRADVAADLDFSRVEQTEEKYDPKSAVIRSQQTTQESRNAGALRAGGVSGARANDPAAQPVPPAATTAQPVAAGDQRAASTTNYEIDKIVRHTIGGGAGRVTRMSVSVLVDYQTVEGNKVARTPEELKKMQELVAAAVGLDTNRGDQIVMQTIPFDQPSLEVTKPTWLESNRDLVKLGIKYGALAVAVLLLLLFVIRPARRALRVASSQPSQKLLASGTTSYGAGSGIGGAQVGARTPSSATPLIENQNGELTALGSPRTVAELEAEMEEEVKREIGSRLQPVVKRATVIKKQLVEQSHKEPELLAMTVRSWLQDA